ncbi:hypothetical protein [Agrobacterium sp. Azo12]|uniref:hypothetical protein n=1 Tax=Agrobacterium sp. Azo12 TaxID=3031129 RepID=UPI0034A0C45E
MTEECLPKLDGLEDVGQKSSYRGTVPVKGFQEGELTAICYFKTETWLNPLHSLCLGD